MNDMEGVKMRETKRFKDEKKAKPAQAKVQAQDSDSPEWTTQFRPGLGGIHRPHSPSPAELFRSTRHLQ